MIVLNDSQVEDILAILIRLLTGENCPIADVETAISYLQDERVSCPFERLSMTQLANELIRVAKGDQQA